MKQFIIFIAFIVLGLAISGLLTGTGADTFGGQADALSESVIDDIDALTP